MSASNSVLLVDDDSFIADMYSRKFEAAGWQVQAASNAEDALKIIETTPPHVLLLDINLPGMSGLELLSVLREKGLLADATIVMLTNQGSDGEIEVARSAGVQGYIVKAMTIPSEVVSEVTRLHQAKQHNSQTTNT